MKNRVNFFHYTDRFYKEIDYLYSGRNYSYFSALIKINEPIDPLKNEQDKVKEIESFEHLKNAQIGESNVIKSSITLHWFRTLKRIDYT